MRGIHLSRLLGLLTLVGLTGCADAPRIEAPSAETGGQPLLGATPDARRPRTAAPTSHFEITREPWSFDGADGSVISTRNYAIYTTVALEELLETLPLFLERSLARYATALAELPMPDRRLETYLFESRREWWRKTVDLLPEQSEDLRNLGRGGFSARGVSVLYYIDWQGETQDTLAIAAHEGWHQYTQRTFRHPLPIWLEEGIATYMEGFHVDDVTGAPIFTPRRNIERRNELENAIEQDRLIPLHELLSRTPQEFLGQGKEHLLTYYAQVWALTLFLSEGHDGKYAAALATALGDAADGRLLIKVSQAPAVVAAEGRRSALMSRTGPWLILAYFARDVGAFERSYRAFARDLAREQS